MSLSNAAENSILLLIFNATTWALWAEDLVASPTTDIDVHLHTGDPGEAGTTTTSECAYGAYAVVAVVRSGAGWDVTTDTATPIANIDFPAATSGTETASHFSLSADTGTVLLASGTVSPNISITTGVTPRLTTATAITLD